MSDVETTTWRFRDRGHPDPVGHVQRAVTTAAYPVQARVRMSAPADEVSRRISSTSATVTALDEDTCLLEAGAASAEALAVHLAWAGLPFEVLEPSELVTACRRLGGLLTAAADR